MNSNASSFEDSPASIATRYRMVRAATMALCEPLDIEDFNIQSMPEASPAKWHLAHTTWFFETFVLEFCSPSYQPFHVDYPLLFNSYYAACGPRLDRSRRGQLSRPSLTDIFTYRNHVDARMEETLATTHLNEEVMGRIILGLHHEQQHQELILTDLKNGFYVNPLRPSYRQNANTRTKNAGPMRPAEWVAIESGVHQIGVMGQGFAFDNEMPSHRVFLEPFEIQSRLVTNREFLAFMEDGGYQRESLWLSKGWDAAQSQHWNSPLYWENVDGQWRNFTLTGTRPIESDAPVCHVSFFEADAYARWAGARLPTEFEWEAIAAPQPMSGNFLESQEWQPIACEEYTDRMTQLYGDAWEWTRSAYDPYPGFQSSEGALGEYNGKFMSGQMVLRGGSCATPQDHIRASYRNFFPPETRWQFTGIRLARSMEERDQ